MWAVAVKLGSLGGVGTEVQWTFMNMDFYDVIGSLIMKSFVILMLIA